MQGCYGNQERALPFSGWLPNGDNEPRFIIHIPNPRDSSSLYKIKQLQQNRQL